MILAYLIVVMVTFDATTLPDAVTGFEIEPEEVV